MHREWTWIVHGELHGKHKALPQFYWTGCYFPVFVLILPVFHFDLDFFSHCGVVFGRWVVHTSVSRFNGSQLKVGHFSQPFALCEWIPSPLIYSHHERKGPK